MTGMIAMDTTITGIQLTIPIRGMTAGNWNVIRALVLLAAQAAIFRRPRRAGM
jgi:hypothetical protein